MLTDKKNHKSLNTIVLKFLIIFMMIIVLMFQAFLLDSISDPYLTKKFYASWILGLKQLNFSSVFFFELYDISLLTIKSPEIGAHLTGLLVSKIFGDYALDFLKFGLLIIFILSLDSKKTTFLKQFILIIYLFFFSYYFFVLNYITFRLLIATIFLVMSFVFVQLKKPFWSGTSLAIAISCHFSLLIIFPFLFLISKGTEINPFNFLFNKMRYKFTIGLFFIFMVNLLIILSISGYPAFERVNLNKIEFINFLPIWLLPILALVALISLYLRNNLIVNDVLLFVFVILSFLVFGTDRLVMLYSIICFIVLFFNPKFISLNSVIKYKFGNSWLFYALAYVMYDLKKYIFMILNEFIL